MRRASACALAVLLLAVSTGCPRKAKTRVDLAYVPGDAAAVAIVNVKQALGSKLLEPVLQDQGVIETIRDLPIDPRKIERLTVAGSPWRGERRASDPPLCPVVVVRFTEPVDGKATLEQFAPSGHAEFERRSHQGATYYRASPDTLFFQPDERTVVLTAQEEMLKELISGGASPGPIFEKLRAADAEADVVAVVLTEPFRGLLKDAPKSLPPGLAAAPGLGDITSLPDQLKSATFTVSLAKDTLAKLVLDCADSESAKKVHGGVQKGLEAAKAMVTLAGMMARGAPGAKEIEPEAQAALDAATQFVKGIQASQSGEQVIVTAVKPAGLEQFIASLPAAIRKARDAAKGSAERLTRLNHVKQIASAMHEYHERRLSLPPAALCDKQGKPLLSWRVAILPYLGEGRLYMDFRQNEPWDSPANKQLLERMPAVYQGQRAAKDGNTSVMLFTGRGTPFEEGKRLTLAGIKDGTSNTIMVIEAGADKAVPWTKPEDLSFDAAAPKAALGQASPPGYPAALFDGSVFTLRPDVSEETLRRLVNPNDAKPVDVSEATVSSKSEKPAFPGAKGSSRGKTTAPLFKKP